MKRFLIIIAIVLSSNLIFAQSTLVADWVQRAWGPNGECIKTIVSDEQGIIIAGVYGSGAYLVMNT